MNNQNIQNTQNIYRLIKPYQSDKVYEAKTTLHGAGKCYRELKKTKPVIYCGDLNVAPSDIDIHSITRVFTVFQL